MSIQTKFGYGFAVGLLGMAITTTVFGANITCLDPASIKDPRHPPAPWTFFSYNTSPDLTSPFTLASVVPQMRIATCAYGKPFINGFTYTRGGTLPVLPPSPWHICGSGAPGYCCEDSLAGCPFIPTN